jgi:hypothetical protein
LKSRPEKNYFYSEKNILFVIPACPARGGDVGGNPGLILAKYFNNSISVGSLHDFTPESPSIWQLFPAELGVSRMTEDWFS